MFLLTDFNVIWLKKHYLCRTKGVFQLKEIKMRKFASMFALAAFMACGIAKAQSVGAESENRRDTSETEMLRQEVSVLSQQVKDAKQVDLSQKIWKDRAKYFNIGFVKQSLTSKDDYIKYKSDVGVNITWGKTYYLHKKPLWGMVKFGLDWTWMDFNYVKYSSVEEKYAYEDDFSGYEFGSGSGYDDSFGSEWPEEGEEDFNLDFGCHQLEYAMQIGPSITVNPIHHLKVSTYFRFQPSASIMLLDDEVYYGFVPFFNFGAAVAWKAISIGVEGRWGSTKYHGVSVDDEDDGYYYEGEDMEVSDLVDTFTQRMRTKSFRVYLSFRF